MGTSTSIDPDASPAGLHRLTRTLYMVRGFARAWMVVLVVLGVAVATSASAQETPRLIKSDVTISDWCGDHAAIVTAPKPGTIRSRANLDDLIWVDLLTREQVILSSILPPSNADERRFVMSFVSCSPDGRWVFVEYFRAFEEGESECDTFDAKKPTTAVWDTKERKYYIVAQGYWHTEWAPGGSVLIHHPRVSCFPENDVRNRFHLPPSMKGIHAFSLRDLIRRALGGNSGWTDEYEALMFNGRRYELLRWPSADHFVVFLTERRTPGENEPREGDAKGDDLPLVPETAVLLLVRIKNSTDFTAQQLNEAFPNDPGSIWPRLAIPQIDPDDTQDILAASKCEGRTNYPDCGSVISHKSIEVDLQRYCQNLTRGDVEAFCRAAPPLRSLSWSQLRRHGRTLLVKTYEVPIQIPGEYAEKTSDLFLIQDDKGGYLK